MVTDIAPPEDGRLVTLVLCTADGTVLGSARPIAVEVPWWPEAGPVVAAARRAFGIDVQVLRLLQADPSRGSGGHVTYLAQVDGTQIDGAQIDGAQVDGVPPVPALPPLLPWRGRPTADEPLRQAWARPGGPDVDLAWADGELARAGVPRTGPAKQVKSWNLSSIWALPTVAGTVWLKHVPPFLAHEGPVMRELDPAAVPRLLAAHDGRVLLADVPGRDRWAADVEEQARMVQLLVQLQTASVDRVPLLLRLGLPDWRGPALQPAAHDVVGRTADQLDAPVVAALERLLRGLPERFAALTACGVPDSLVHGDFWPGNLRGDGDRLVLLDWGDSGVGHPLLDQAAFLDRVPAAARPAIRAAWSRRWRDNVPGSDPDRASELLAPVAALRQAVVYRAFLDGIEPDERIYHAADPATWLSRAVDLAAPDGHAAG